MPFFAYILLNAAGTTYVGHTSGTFRWAPL
jgi:hypothetical protein